MDELRCPHCGAAWTERTRNFCEFCGVAVATTPTSPPPARFGSGIEPPLPSPTSPRAAPAPPTPPSPSPARAPSTTPPTPPRASATSFPARSPASSSFEPPHVPPLPIPPLPAVSTLGTSASGPPPAGPDTGQFSSSPATALKVVLVSLAISLLPCCGIGFVVLAVLYFVLGMNRR